jgi:hypothetical protein
LLLAQFVLPGLLSLQDRPTDRIRCILLDGLDDIPPASLEALLAVLDKLTSSTQLPSWLRVVIFSRPGMIKPRPSISQSLDLMSTALFDELRVDVGVPLCQPGCEDRLGRPCSR